MSKMFISLEDFSTRELEALHALIEYELRTRDEETLELARGDTEC